MDEASKRIYELELALPGHAPPYRPQCHTSDLVHQDPLEAEIVVGAGIPSDHSRNGDGSLSL